MSKTVKSAFSTFLNDYVNLDNDEYLDKALPSRDWLISQLDSFEAKIQDYPRYYSEKDIYFGSFHRKTKKKPLDDIDLMKCLTGDGSTYTENLTYFIINVPNSAIQLKKLCTDGTNHLNSIKVVEKFKSGLKDIGQYKNAEIKREGEAVTLKLISYDWNFDIVPAFYANPSIADGKNFYLIPDGKGNWKKTNPELDSIRTTKVNQQHDGKILELIRLVKYWQKRKTMPTMGSYILETMILDYYEDSNEIDPFHTDVEFMKIINYIYNNIGKVVRDTKGISDNINDIDAMDRDKIKTKINTDLEGGKEAIKHENEGKIEQSINKWRNIFGDDFPEYG